MSKKQIWSRVIPLAVAVIGSGAAYLGLCVPRQKELVPPEPRFAAVLIDAKTKSFINDASIMLIGSSSQSRLSPELIHQTSLRLRRVFSWLQSRLPQPNCTAIALTELHIFGSSLILYSIKATTRRSRRMRITLKITVAFAL
ncbi:MAG: hypothetical protein EON58_03070 [Alphaproteobacteria bacterium]|nr:MAG: hypothetical protein EON58_03070 [Alphaproteobacteria bacterium]